MLPPPIVWAVDALCFRHVCPSVCASRQRHSLTDLSLTFSYLLSTNVIISSCTLLSHRHSLYWDRSISVMQANHKANEERKNCILDINDVQGHADNLRSKSRQDFNNSLSPRRFVTSSSLLASALWLVFECHRVLPGHIGGAFAKPYGRDFAV